MTSLNRASLIGNLGADPEVRRLNDGRPVVSFRVATSETWKDKQSGEKRERTEWHQVIVFSEGLCEVVERYCRKGSKVFVEGQLQTRKWQAQDGSDRYTTEVVLRNYVGQIVLLGSAGGRPPVPAEDSYGADSSASSQPAAGYSRSALDDDDIPFAPEVR